MAVNGRSRLPHTAYLAHTHKRETEQTHPAAGNCQLKPFHTYRNGCASIPVEEKMARAKDRAIANQLRMSAKKTRLLRLLLLGAGQSGKTLSSSNEEFIYSEQLDTSRAIDEEI